MGIQGRQDKRLYGQQRSTSQDGLLTRSRFEDPQLPWFLQAPKASSLSQLLPQFYKLFFSGSSQ